MTSFAHWHGQKHTFQHPASPPPPPCNEVECDLSLWRTERTSKEVPYLEKFSEGKEFKSQLMWKEPKPYLELTKGFSTIQRLGPENSRSPSYQQYSPQASCVPPNKSPFPFLKFKAPFLSVLLIARTSLRNNGHAARVWALHICLFDHGHLTLLDWSYGWMCSFPSLYTLKYPAGMLRALGSTSPNRSSFSKSLSH